jgi:hypothetical protein
VLLGRNRSAGSVDSSWDFYPRIHLTRKTLPTGSYIANSHFVQVLISVRLLLMATSTQGEDRHEMGKNLCHILIQQEINASIHKKIKKVKQHENK